MSLQIRLSQYILCINEHAVCVSSARRLIPSDFFRWPVRKPRKICSSAHNQLWPYVLPTIPIEKSSLYPPEVHSINLVKRIQRIKKKKLTQDWGQRADGLTGCQLVHAERTKNRDKIERRASFGSGAGSQVRAEVRGQMWKQIIRNKL